MTNDLSRLSHKEFCLGEFPSHHKLETEHDVLGVFLPWFKDKMREYRWTTPAWPVCRLYGCGAPLVTRIMQFQGAMVQKVRVFIICPNIKFCSDSDFIESVLRAKGYL